MLIPTLAPLAQSPASRNTLGKKRDGDICIICRHMDLTNRSDSLLNRASFFKDHYTYYCYDIYSISKINFFVLFSLATFLTLYKDINHDNYLLMS